MRLEDLGTPALTWLDLKAIVVHRPLESALSRSIDGADALWGLSEHLLAAIADRLASVIWQNGGGKGRKPQPIKRPGVGPKKANVARHDLDAMTIVDFEERMKERRARQEQQRR